MVGAPSYLLHFTPTSSRLSNTMRFLLKLPFALGLLSQAVSAQKAVFAHVVVGNTAAHSQATWAQDIQLARNTGIDAFVLNIAYPDGNIPGKLRMLLRLLRLLVAASNCSLLLIIWEVVRLVYFPRFTDWLDLKLRKQCSFLLKSRPS